MKKSIMTAAAALCLGIACSCSEEDYKTVDPSAGNILEMTASGTEIKLDEKKADSEALALNWTTGTNKGTGNAITYTFEMALKDSDYSSGYKEELGRKAYSKTWTAKALNDFLKSNFGAQSGVKASYKARVTASVAEYDDLAQESSVEFTVTPYEPVSTTLYMIGGAAPNGWSADNATELTRTSTGVFSWTGTLNEGELKFITTSGQFWPAYVREGSDASGKTLRYFSEQPSDDLDLKFNIPEARGYKITADILNLTFTLEEADVNKPPYDAIYFVGDPTGWSFVRMTQDPVNPFVFRYGTEFTSGGEFKFGTSDGSWENMYKASEESASIKNTGVQFVKGFDTDPKWKINDEETGKAYKIAFDITPGKESMNCVEFVPYESLWLIGSAAPHGWSLDDAASDDKCRLKAGDDKYILTWTGDLSAGEMKISCELKREWDGCWFMPTSANKPFNTVSDEVISFVDSNKDSGVDRKWIVENAGNYTITVNQLAETITIVKN